MSFRNIDLGRELALLDPAPWDESEMVPLTARELAILASIKRGETARSARGRASAPRRRWGRLALPALATAAAATALVVVLPLLAPSAASALTPPPLEYSAVEQSAGEIIQDARSQLLSAGGDAAGGDEALRGAQYSGWFVQVDPEKTDPVVIMPEDVALTWKADYSGEQVITAGVPFWADPARDAPFPNTVPAEGTVLSAMDFAVGEFVVPAAAVPGDSPAELMETLTALGLTGDGEDAAALIDATDSLLSLWTISDVQQAGLLTMLDDSEGLKVLGNAVDRQGRDVIALGATSSDLPGTSRTILLSAESGRIIGVESARITAEPPLAAGDVISYKLWKD